MEHLHPIIAGWIAKLDKQRREAPFSESEWVRNNPPPPLTEADHRRHKVTDYLFKAIEARGGTIAENQKGNLEASIEGEKLEFQLRELTRQERVTTTSPFSSRVTNVGTGKLIFALRTYLRGKHNEEWRETSTRTMEDTLPTIIERLFEGAQILKAWHREIQQEEERRRQAAADRQEAKRLAELQQRQRQKFAETAMDWRVSQQIREFIAALEVLPFDPDHIVQGKTVAEWLNWARSVADDIDPLHSGGVTDLFNRLGDGRT